MKRAQVTCFETATAETDVAVRKCKKPNNDGLCCGVADEKGDFGDSADETPGDRTCAQCRGEIDGKERLVSVSGRSVWLHSECERFWLRALEEDNGTGNRQEETHDLLARTGLQCRKNHRGDGDLGFVFGRCRSGRRWFWFACTYGVGENRTDRGWSDSEEKTREDARIAITRIAGDRPAYVNVMHGWASLELKKINAEKRRARPPSDAKGSRVIEYLYGRDRCGGDCNFIYRFRITKRTAKRIFYIRKGEYIDEHGEPIDYGISLRRLLRQRDRFVDRQKLEADATFTIGPTLVG